MIMVAGAPRYHRGLLRELRTLSQPDCISKIGPTSLGALVNGHGSDNSNVSSLSQISKLNRSQRQATVKALTNRFSVITGPPGTGKSQVVLSILANAFERNESVLFSSKNNKAVDVVCERILDEVDFPINLRLGAKTTNRDYTTDFLNLLDKVLSGGDRDSIKTRYTRFKDQFEASRKRYFLLIDELENVVRDRNRIDELDQACKYYEKNIEANLLLKARQVPYRKSELLVQAQSQLQILQSDRKPLAYKLFGLFSKRYPYKKLHSYCKEAKALLGDLVDPPTEITPSAEVYAQFLLQAQIIYDYLKIYSDITELRKKITIADINALSRDVEAAENEFVDSCQRFLEALGRYRIIELTAEQRKSLTNYHAVVKQLSGEYPGNQAYAHLKQQQEKLFSAISKILPIWSVTNLATSEHFPFAPNVFDLVVIDEASQSDIASALPLLYRAKKAVIIGDPQQLRHISSVRKQQDTRLMQKYNLLGDDSLRFSYSAQSLYDCSRGAVGKDDVTLLNEHYRSHFSIIEFSNREWYDGYLDIRTNYENLFFPPDTREHIEWIDVRGKTVRPGKSALNQIEAERVLEVLQEVFNEYKDRRPSVGIVTPFREQADYFTARLSQLYDEETIRKHFLLANVVHLFQGDERDIVIFSPVISAGAQDRTIGFLRATSNLFNVAITRARSILWVVGDRTACMNAGIKYLKDFVEYIDYKKYKNIDLPYSGFQSPWEKKFFEVLKAEGLNPVSQHPAGPYFIDLAITIGGRKLAVEADGAYWHASLSGERLESDIVRDKNLRRMGWEIIRFWVHDLKYDLKKCVETIIEKIS